MSTAGNPSSKARMMAVLWILLVLGPVPVGADGQNRAGSLEPKITAEIDKIFSAYDKPETPGCALGILKDGHVVYSRGYGWANLEYDVPVTPDTIFEAGSVSKQFTVGAVQILAEEGKLSLDDDIRTYVPEVPDFGSVITIRNLMTHTSGLRDQWHLLSTAGRPTGNVVHTLEEILDLVNRQEDLNFPPGEDYLYSNTNFSLLAWVVLRVSGKSLADFSVERVFKPLGMTRTRWRDDHRDIVKGRATAYSPAGPEKYRQNMPFTNVYGNGGLLTTVGDLLLWAENFWTAKVIGRNLLAEMEVRARLNDGTALHYALGLEVSEYKGVRQVLHGGSTAGYRAFLVRYPDEHLAVAILSNYSGTNAADLAYGVTDVLLAGKLAPPKKLQPIKVSPQTLGEMTGLYRDLRTDDILVLGVRDGRLLLAGGGQGLELFPFAPDRFLTLGGEEYVFLGGKGSEPLQIRRSSEREPPDVYTRVRPARLSPSDLEAYEGHYWSNELEVIYTVSAEDGKLSIRHRPEPARPLEPTYQDGFVVGRGPGGFLVRFLRDSSGEVAGMSVNTGRVRHLGFSKLQSGDARGLPDGGR